MQKNRVIVAIHGNGLTETLLNETDRDVLILRLDRNTKSKTITPEELDALEDKHGARRPSLIRKVLNSVNVQVRTGIETIETFRIQSDSYRSKLYTVVRKTWRRGAAYMPEEEYWTCNCPHFEHRLAGFGSNSRGECKHITRAKLGNF